MVPKQDLVELISSGKEMIQDVLFKHHSSSFKQGNFISILLIKLYLSEI